MIDDDHDTPFVFAGFIQLGRRDICRISESLCRDAGLQSA
jgi:hypothetical protein